ncbi:MAG: class I SAM-dependent methyltransferase, partial [SAR324 cluster bacterium]|nr:class I SAM-dependent methyltransferase [SAR324 cluster bacterium]
ELEQGGYEHHCFSENEIGQHKKLGRVWKKIIKLTEIEPPARLFELGCGGGIHLAKLALNGFEVHGIDVSDTVAEKAQNYLHEINTFQTIKASLEVADVFEYSGSEIYQMSFHFGVIEHFLESSDRLKIWQILYDLTLPGGWIVSVVPCGQHFMREMMRNQRLGGYNIPEIDYSCSFHHEEFNQINLTSISTIPHNYFSFLSAHPFPLISKVLHPLFFAVGNLSLPYLPISNAIKEHFAGSLIVVGQKPL